MLQLHRRGVNQKRVGEKIARADNAELASELHITTCLRKVLELATVRVNRLGRPLVEPDDLLFAILEEGENRAVQILRELNPAIDLDELAIKVMQTAAVLRSRQDFIVEPIEVDELSIEDLEALLVDLQEEILSCEVARKELRQARRELRDTLDYLRSWKALVEVLLAKRWCRQDRTVATGHEVAWGDDVPNDPVLQGLRGVKQTLKNSGLLTPELEHQIGQIKCTYVSRPPQ